MGKSKGTDQYSSEVKGDKGGMDNTTPKVGGEYSIRYCEAPLVDFTKTSQNYVIQV